MKKNGEESVSIATEYIKLDSLLKYAGVADSGGSAKLIVQSGDVSVNGQACTMRGKKVYPGDLVELPGLRISVAKDGGK